MIPSIFVSPGCASDTIPPAFADDADDLVGRRAAARHEGGRPGADEPIEGVVPIPRETRRHERARRSAGRPMLRPAFANADASSASMSIGVAERAQPLRDLPHPPDPIGALRLQERRQPGVGRVDEIAQHVHVAALFDGRDLDAVHEPHAVASRLGSRLGEPRHRIVVGDADHRQAGCGRARDEDRRRQRAVGCGGVEMEIDQEALAAGSRRALRFWTFLVLAGRRRWRSTSERYSRISSSRCDRSSSANSRNTFLPSESSNFSP